jgi:hypothetical protein
MTTTTFSEIKTQLLTEWDSLEEDRLSEVADSLTPIYHSEIIQEWQSLSMEESDTWRELGYEITPETTILNLMAIDLYHHYQAQVARAYEEIRSEREED